MVCNSLVCVKLECRVEEGLGLNEVFSLCSVEFHGLGFGPCTIHVPFHIIYEK